MIQVCILFCRSTAPDGLIRVAVTYTSENPLELKYPYGFEVGCVDASDSKSAWISGTAKSVVGNHTAFVEFSVCPVQYTAKMIRYCWRTDPCTFKMCPVYAKDLPSPPFILKLP